LVLIEWGKTRKIVRKMARDVSKRGRQVTDLETKPKTYSSDQIRARVSEVLAVALTKLKDDAPDLISADLHHAPQSGNGTAIIINVKLATGDSRIIINVPPDGACRPLHPDRIGGCGNIFDETFKRVLAAVIFRATSSRDHN
jgi:hypothetical protein